MGLFEDIFAPVDEEKESRYLDVINERQSLGVDSLSRLQGQIDSRKEILEDEGLPIPPQESSVLYNVLDTIDALGQGTRGVLAKIGGVNDYKDKSLLDAWSYGQDKDLGVADILAQTSVFAGDGLPMRAARGVLGFIGDVVTDPLSYVSFGTAGITKIGGRGVTATGEAIHRVISQEMRKAADHSSQAMIQNLNLTGNIDLIQTTERAKGAIKAAEPFRKLATLTEQRKSLARKGVWKTGDLQTLQAVDKITSQVNDYVADGFGLKVEDFASPEDYINTVNQATQMLRANGYVGTADSLVDAVFKPKAFRLTGVLSGLGKGDIPLITSNAWDVPILTDVSAKLFDYVGGAGYSATYNVDKWLNKVTTVRADLGDQASAGIKAAAVVGQAMRQTKNSVASFSKLLSKRALAANEFLGSKTALNNVKDIDVARGGLFSGVVQDMEFTANRILEHDGLGADLANAFEAGLSHGLTHEGLKMVSQGVPVEDVYRMKTRIDPATKEVIQLRAEHAGGVAPDITKVQAELAAVAQKWDQVSPGLGGHAVKYGQRVLEDFVDYAKKEQQYGLLDRTSWLYINHVYEEIPGMGKVGTTGKSASVDFSEGKKYATFQEARVAGLKPINDLPKLWAARTLAHRTAMAEKDFLERFTLEYSMSPTAYEMLRLKTMSANLDEAVAAKTALGKMGMNVSPAGLDDQAIWAKRLAPDADISERMLAPKLRKDGTIMSLEEYDTLLQRANDPALRAKDRRIARKTAKELGILAIKKDTPDAIKKFERWKLEYDIKNQGIYGFLRHPATGDVLRPDDYTAWWDAIEAGPGANPRVFEMAEQNLDQLGLKQAGRNSADLDRIKIDREAYEKVQNQRLGRLGENFYTAAGANTVNPVFLKYAKKLPLEEQQIWHGRIPQSWADMIDDAIEGKNLLGWMAQKLSDSGRKDPLIDPIYKLTKLFSNYVGAFKSLATIPWPAFWGRNLGSAQVQAMKAASALGYAMNPASLYDIHNILYNNKTLVSQSGEQIAGKQIQAELRQLAFNTDPYLAVDAMSYKAESLAALKKTPAFSRNSRYQRMVERQEAQGWLAKARGGLEKGASWAENYGRTALYVQLRKQGYDPASAANEVKTALIDYQSGKTKFERLALNNIFLFYSFARGQASNTFVQMLTKPGSLGTQLYAHNNIAHMMTDPSSYNPNEDIEESIKSTRTKEMLASYIGDNKAGVPEMLVGTGMPVEEIAKYMSIYTPNSLSLRDIFAATGESTRRTAKMVVSQFNPIFKAFIEIPTGKNLFFDRPLSDKTLRKFPKWEKDISTVLHHPFRAIPDVVWDGLDVVTKEALAGRDNGDGTFTVNPYALYAISQIAPYAGRFLSTREFLSKPGVEPYKKYLQLFSGVKVREMQAEKSNLWEEHNRLKEYFDEQAIPFTKRDRAIDEMIRANSEQANALH